MIAEEPRVDATRVTELAQSLEAQSRRVVLVERIRIDPQTTRIEDVGITVSPDQIERRVLRRDLSNGSPQCV